MERSIRLDLPLLLPEVQDMQDKCVARLVALLERRDGVSTVHVVRPGEAEPPPTQRPGIETEPAEVNESQLCLHYDPERLTLRQVTALARAAGAEVTERFAHAIIPFRAVGSEDEGARLEAALRSLPGVTAAAVNFAGQVARVEFDRRRTDVATISARLGEDGAEPRTGELPPDAKPEDAPPEISGWYAHNRELVWSLIAGALTAAGWVVGRGQVATPPFAIALFLGAYLFGARDNVGHLLKDLRRRRFHFNIDLLMVVAAVGAAILDEWFEGALLLFLFSLGHALEHYALGRARNAIKALAELAPQTATVLVGAIETETPIERVQQGQLVLIRPASRFPVDGIVSEGRSAVNQAPITGESMPVLKTPGQQVFAGSVNGEGALVVRVTAAIGDRTLDRVIRLVTEAETQKAPTQQFTDRFERIFVPLVLVGAIALVFAPPALGLLTWDQSFYRAMVVLVAASPCALALGTPAAILAGIAQGARNGVLVKGGAYLETLGTIDAIAFDKTGTITMGEPSVTDVEPAAGVTDTELLSVAGSVERRSQHPLARAIVREANERGLTLPDVAGLESVTGRGVMAQVDGQLVEVGRLLLFEDAGTIIPEAVRSIVDRLEENGRTTVVVRRALPSGNPTQGGEKNTKDGWLGVIGVADQPRPDVPATLQRLRDVGIRHMVMLTGDNAGVGRAIGAAVGLDDVKAGLLPEDKVAVIRTFTDSGRRVAMVGDGVNDAPALAQATVGIAMGGAGTAAALETADVVLMGDDLGKLPFAIALSRATRSAVRQNLFFSLGVIAVLVLTSVLGVTSISSAVIFHEGSTLAVIANGLRLLAFRGPAAASKGSL